VAHGHLLRVLAARWIATLPQTGRSLVLEVGTLSELGWEHETPAILRWNT
jgi:probable phosphoglycerate mutase